MQNVQSFDLGSIAPNAVLWTENGTVFVGLDLGDSGRLVLGCDPAPELAFQKAVDNHNG